MNERRFLFWDIFGGHKCAILIWFIGITFWISLIWSFIIKDWGYLKFYTPWVVGIVAGYLGINLARHITRNNNAKK